jgi:hypothetical protein
VTGHRHRRVRAAALLAGGSFALHQLRYLLGYGVHSHRELAQQGHAYMTLVAPLVAVLLVIAIADLAARLAAARPGGRSAPVPTLRRLWALATGCLLATYCLQESIEGAVAPGHPSGLLGVVGHGGAVAAPLAAAIGLVVALALRGADRAIELADAPPVRIAAPRPALSLGVARLAHPLGGRRMGRRLGGRSPPAPSIP